MASSRYRLRPLVRLNGAIGWNCRSDHGSVYIENERNSPVMQLFVMLDIVLVITRASIGRYWP
jgi:hypothetical protein